MVAPAKARPFMVATRASGSSGNVTTEISHRSTFSSRRTPDARSRRPLTVRKPIDKPVERAGAHQRVHLARAFDLRHQAARRVEPARVLFQCAPHADRLVGVVLEQHLDAGGPALAQAFGEGAGQHDVAAHVLFVKEAGVAFEAAVHLDRFEIEARELHLVTRHYVPGAQGIAARAVRGSTIRQSPKFCV